MLFFLYINDICADIESEIRLFANGFVYHHDIKEIEDALKIQKDIDRLGIRIKSSLPVHSGSLRRICYSKLYSLTHTLSLNVLTVLKGSHICIFIKIL